MKRWRALWKRNASPSGLRNRSLAAWTTASVGVAYSAMGNVERGAQSYREALEWAAGGSNRLIEIQVPLWLAVRVAG